MPKAMHIHFWADIRNTAGSVEKVILAFAAHGQRWEHSVACCSPRAEHSTPFSYHGVPVTPFKEHALRNRIQNKILGLGTYTYPDLIRVIEGARPDLLHFHNRQELVDAVLKRLSYRPAVAVHYHRHFSAPAIPRCADRLIFPSLATRAHIQAIAHPRALWAVVANPLSLDLTARGQRTAFRTPDPERPTFLFGGGRNPIKGGRELVEAFSSLRHRQARLVLAGRGAGELAASDPRIQVRGELPADDFFDLVAASDVVVMPSYEESFGLLAQEAMLLKRLLLTTGSGGLREFVDEDCAIMVRPRSVRSLRAGLEQTLSVLAEPLRHRRYLQQAFERVQAFHPARLVRELEDCYESCL